MMQEQSYFNKIVILFIFTFINIFIIWFFMIREESSDWISEQVIHQVSPYVITDDNGGLTVDNVIIGYEFRLPLGFNTVGARNLSFSLEKDGQKLCEIKHYYVNVNKAKKLESDSEKSVILFNNTKLVFELAGKNTEKDLCSKYLASIENSLIVN